LQPYLLLYWRQEIWTLHLQFCYSLKKSQHVLLASQN
jgi:hypothetical protein